MDMYKYSKYFCRNRDALDKTIVFQKVIKAVLTFTKRYSFVPGLGTYIVQLN